MTFVKVFGLLDASMISKLASTIACVVQQNFQDTQMH